MHYIHVDLPNKPQSGGNGQPLIYGVDKIIDKDDCSKAGQPPFYKVSLMYSGVGLTRTAIIEGSTEFKIVNILFGNEVTAGVLNTGKGKEITREEAIEMLSS